MKKELRQLIYLMGVPASMIAPFLGYLAMDSTVLKFHRGIIEGILVMGIATIPLIIAIKSKDWVILPIYGFVFAVGASIALTNISGFETCRFFWQNFNPSVSILSPEQSGPSVCFP